MGSSSLLGIADKLRVHSRPGEVAFLIYEILADAGYSDDEIRDVSTALTAIVPITGRN